MLQNRSVIWMLITASAVLAVAVLIPACSNGDDDDDDAAAASDDDLENDGPCGAMCEKTYDCGWTSSFSGQEGYDACVVGCEVYSDDTAVVCSLQCDTTADCLAWKNCMEDCA